MSNSEEKIRPVEPARFHKALGLYQAALAAEGLKASVQASSPHPAATDGPQPTDVSAIGAILVLKKEFPEPGEFHSLSHRLGRLAEVIGDKKLARWGMVKYSPGGGFEIHDAVINALATAPFRKSGVLDKVAFHDLVKAELTRVEAPGTGDAA